MIQFQACQVFHALKRKFHEATDLPLSNLACEPESSHPRKTVQVYFEILTGVYSAIPLQFDILSRFVQLYATAWFIAYMRKAVFLK